jgi:RNA polymerase sigma-70 factor (ECF subfamily)
MAQPNLIQGDEMDNTASSMWEQLHDGLRAFIAKRVANETETEDLLQDIFLKVHQHVDKLQEPERMVSWVFQITRNAIVDHYRSADRRREVPAGLATEMDQDNKAMIIEENEREAKSELSHCLRPMIDRLSSDYQEAIRLVEFEGFTNEEAARKLGLSISGMKSRVQRGRQQLRKMLDDCCLIELDGRRGVVEFEKRRPDSC